MFFFLLILFTGWEPPRLMSSVPRCGVNRETLERWKNSAAAFEAHSRREERPVKA